MIVTVSYLFTPQALPLHSIPPICELVLGLDREGHTGHPPSMRGVQDQGNFSIGTVHWVSVSKP